MKYLLTLIALLLVVNMATAQKKETRQERLEREWKEEFPSIVEEIQLPTATYLYVFELQGHDFILFDPESGKKEISHSPGCRRCNKSEPVNLYRPYRIPALPPYLGLRK